MIMPEYSGRIKEQEHEQRNGLEKERQEKSETDPERKKKTEARQVIIVELQY
jgi:hypothetical protein